MRRAVGLFHGGQSGIKSLERRMYLVLNLLEVIDTWSNIHIP
jgi:hypothetical protein